MSTLIHQQDFARYGTVGSGARRLRNPLTLAPLIAALLLVVFVLGGVQGAASAFNSAQSGSQVHETLFVPGPTFNVREVVYPSAHDFDKGSGIDTCLSLSVPPGDTFTLGLIWEALVEGLPGAGDLDLYLYLDAACTEAALLTSSFNSNAYTGELLEITPRVRNIGSETAIAGVRVGKRSGRGNPGWLQLKVLTGDAVFLEHGTDGPPLPGQDGAPVFDFSGPFELEENSPAGTEVGTVTAVDIQSDPLTFFELEPAAGQTSFQIDPSTGVISVEDPAELDRETSETLVYWIGVTDGNAASLTSVAIDLIGVNDNSPIALDTSVITPPETPISITLEGTDADVDLAQQLTVIMVDVPTRGVVDSPVFTGLTTSSVTYTPELGFLGTDNFTFSVTDGQTTSPPATVTVIVTNDPTQVPTPTPSSPGSGGGGSIPPPVQEAPGPPPLSSSPPSAPRFVRAIPGDSSATFTWQHPLSDGGAPIEGYRFFNINTSTSTIFDRDAMEGKVLDLENGTSYLFQVRAFNAAGLGEGALVGPVTPISGEPAELDVQASLHPDDTVTVWWQPPDDDHLKPIVEYQLWLEDGDLIEVVEPDQPFILNIKDLENDKEHAFRVTGINEDDEIVAVGVTEPVHVPPTLASLFEPLPEDAILVPLTPEAREMLQFSLQEIAGGEGLIPELPAILVYRDGLADVFIGVEGLHRAIVVPADFLVDSDQLFIGMHQTFDMQIDFEIAEGISVSGTIETQIDPSGVLFSLALPSVVLSSDISEFGQIASVFAVEYQPQAISQEFNFTATVPDPLPDKVTELLLDPTTLETAAVVEMNRNGFELGDPADEKVGFVLPAGWHEVHEIQGNGLSFVRIDSEGLQTETAVRCDFEAFDLTALCSGEFEMDGGTPAYYALIATTDAPPVTPTAEPTPIGAPAEPSATPGPSLVVVEDPTPEPFIPLPQVTPTSTPEPDEPIVPEPDGGGTSVVTWLMAGVLGLVVVRGAFYAVGRFRS